MGNVLSLANKVNKVGALVGLPGMKYFVFLWNARLQEHIPDSSASLPADKLYRQTESKEGSVCSVCKDQMVNFWLSFCSSCLPRVTCQSDAISSIDAKLQTQYPNGNALMAMSGNFNHACINNSYCIHTVPFTILFNTTFFSWLNICAVECFHHKTTPYVTPVLYIFFCTGVTPQSHNIRLSSSYIV